MKTDEDSSVLELKAIKRLLSLMLVRDGVCRRLSAGDTQHAAVVAGRRREVPHQGSPALRRSPGLRARARPRRRGGAGAEGGQGIQCRCARRPWASPIRSDRAFAEAFAKQDAGKYSDLVARMAKTLFDRDTSPGAEPERLMKLDIPALIVPGRDESHATSAARYLEECLPKAEYWDVPPEGQTESTASARLLKFLDAN